MTHQPKIYVIHGNDDLETAAIDLSSLTFIGPRFVKRNIDTWNTKTFYQIENQNGFVIFETSDKDVLFRELRKLIVAMINWHAEQGN